MSSVGTVACFVLSAASYVPFIGVALWILPRWTPEPPTVGARHRPFAGIGDILRQPGLRGALLTVLTTSLFCAPLVTFSPVLVRRRVSRQRGPLFGRGRVVWSGRPAGRHQPAQHRARGRSASAERVLCHRVRGARWCLRPQSLVLGASTAVCDRRRDHDNQQHVREHAPPSRCKSACAWGRPSVCTCSR